MAAGDVTPGKRRPDGTMPHELEPGEYALASTETHTVWLCSPDGRPGAVDDRWAVMIEDDDTVTVSPSIFWERHETPPGWHGYLERGVWREA